METEDVALPVIPSLPRRDFVDFIPVAGVAALRDPNGTALTQLFFRVQVSSLEDRIPKDSNVRGQKITTKVAHKIRETAADPRNRWFHVYNRGMLITAAKVERLRDGETLRVHLPHNRSVKYGLADGATTYEVLQDLMKSQVEKAAAFGNKFVTVEVLADFPSDENFKSEDLQTDLVAARNTSNQVPDSSIDNHRGEYNFIRDALLSTDYAKKIIWKQNDQVENHMAQVPVMDLVDMILYLNPDIKPMDRADQEHVCHGSNIYGQGANARGIFRTNHESCEKFSEMLPSILALHDIVLSRLSSQYNEGYKHKVKAGSLIFFDARTPYGYDKTPFDSLMAKPVQYPSKVMLHAVMGSFRSLVVERDGKFCWKYPFPQIVALFEKAGARMVMKAKNMNNELRGRFDDFGRGYMLWEAMFDIMKDVSI